MTLKSRFRRPILLAAMALTISATSPARADRCDHLGAQLKSQIDGLTVGKTAANVIYLSHPQAKELTLGCAGRNYANQLYAKADSRKPKPAFLDLVASASAVIFTLPKDDMLRGASRCIKRLGIFYGNDVTMRYRRLDLHCVRTKTDASITISRGTDERGSRRRGQEAAFGQSEIRTFLPNLQRPRSPCAGIGRVFEHSAVRIHTSFVSGTSQSGIVLRI